MTTFVFDREVGNRQKAAEYLILKFNLGHHMKSIPRKHHIKTKVNFPSILFCFLFTIGLQSILVSVITEHRILPFITEHYSAYTTGKHILFLFEILVFFF